MAYPPGHRERVRRKILRSARKLFNRLGYDSVTIEEVMADAGLTRGAFYSYFRSKAELYRDSIAFILAEHPGERWSAGHLSPNSAVRLVDAYLSRTHLYEVEESCPLVTHAAEAARGDRQLRSVFSSVFRSLVSELQAGCTESEQAEEQALAIAALCVGGLSLARGVDDAAFAERVLGVCRGRAQSWWLAGPEQ